MILINLFIISAYSLSAYFFINSFANWFLFSLGLILGFLFLFIDEKFGYKIYQSKNLITRSIIFILVFIPLAIFLITSSGSFIGIGIVISMSFTYAQEFWQINNSPKEFEKKYLWQTGKPWSQQEIKIFTRIFVIATAILAMLVLI